DPIAGAMDETVQSFVLEELAPALPATANAVSLSGMLIPASGGPTWNSAPLEKRYLDLWAVPINYAVFYTSLTSRDEQLTIPGAGTVQTDASCSTNRTAM